MAPTGGGGERRGFGDGIKRLGQRSIRQVTSPHAGAIRCATDPRHPPHSRRAIPGAGSDSTAYDVGGEWPVGGPLHLEGEQRGD